MKKFIGGSGGRYVYSDDFLNLQDLSLSLYSILEGCDNFVISGCEVTGSSMSAGYVWINNHIRKFEGAQSIKFPYYIFEQNSHVSTEYKDEPNKLGQIHYLCSGSSNLPTNKDGVTGEMPQFIEATDKYIPRIGEKLFGRHALQLNSPLTKQTVSKDVEFLGTITSNKKIVAHEASETKNINTGYSIKQSFKEDGTASIGLHLNNVLITDVSFSEDGSVSISKGKTVLAVFKGDGVQFNKPIDAPTIRTKNITLEGLSVFNHSDATDEGSIEINKLGYKGGTSKFRSLLIYDGKGVSIAHVDGKNKKITIVSSVDIKHTGDGVKISNLNGSIASKSAVNRLVFETTDGIMGNIGYLDANTLDLAIENKLGDIIINPLVSVDIKGALKVGGTDIASTYVTKTTYDKAMKSKVDSKEGKGLSTEDFTSELKERLESVIFADTETKQDGLVLLSYVDECVGGRLEKASNLSDLKDTSKARANLSVYSIAKVDELLKGKLNTSDKYTGETFSSAHKKKLEGLQEGKFESRDDEGGVVAKQNGYVTINKILFELTKYAPLELDTYSEEQRKIVTNNLKVYTKDEANEKFSVPSDLLDKQIDFLIKTQEKTKEEAQGILRAQINTPSSDELKSYIRKDKLLADLEVKDDKGKKAVCNTIGAAVASETQSKLKDTGWIGLGFGTVYARQIGNIVCIQGEYTVANIGIDQTLFELPNQIDSPAHSVEYLASQDRTYSNARKFIARINGKSRRCWVVENAIKGQKVAFTLTYMT